MKNYTLLIIIVIFSFSCTGNLDEKDYPEGFLGTWTGKYIGNEVIIKVESKKSLQIQYTESGVAFKANYNFDLHNLVIESPEIWYKVKYMKENSFELEKEGDKSIQKALNITGIVFTRVE
jgi:hypothetical protein